MDRFARLKSMLLMAAADGGLSREELQLLSDRAVEWGLSLDEFESIVEQATGGEVELTIPVVKSDRKEMLVDMVRMMGADGVMHDQEKQLFALVAAKRELSVDEVNEVIDLATKSNEEDPSA